jgi:hypothetical protein
MSSGRTQGYLIQSYDTPLWVPAAIILVGLVLLVEWIKRRLSRRG